MSLAQFSAYHLREIIYNLDVLAIARTTKLTATSKEKVEEETVEHVNVPGPAVETAFYGGEQTEQPEDEDVDAEAWRPRFSLGHDRLTAILSRHSEIAAASRQGRKKPAEKAHADLRRLISFNVDHASSSLQRDATKGAAFVCASAIDQWRFATPRCNPNGNEKS